MHRTLLALALLAGFGPLTASSGAGSARIVVGPNVHVSAARSGVPHLEVVAAAHLSDPQRLVVCAMLDAQPSRSVKSAAYVSQDGGRSWQLGVEATDYFAGDPTCAFGPGNEVYYAHKTNTGYDKAWKYASDMDFLTVHRSTDGGRTWQPPQHGPQTNDRPWIAVDTTSGPHRGRLYAAYEQHVHGESAEHTLSEYRHAVALQGSDDGGGTFSDRAIRALMDQAPPLGSNAGMSSVAVLPDGAVLVLYNHSVIGETQQSTGKPREVRASLHVLASRDGGRSFEPAIKVADVVGGYNQAHTKGVTGNMTVVSAGPHAGRVLVAWSDHRTNRGRILVSRSDDGGRTWSPPALASDDGEAARPEGGPDHFMPVLAVNRDGVVGLLWYDRRENPDNRGYYARFAASTDGGDTWSPSVRVSEQPNSPPGDGAATAGFSLTGGDTAGLTAGADGRFHAAWIDNRSGRQQVWTAVVEVRGSEN